MSETKGGYDCGAGCTCDAVVELSSERTELMEEMAAALRHANAALIEVMGHKELPHHLFMKVWDMSDVIDAVLAKYRGREEASG